jgi:hypothetical protein
MEQEQVIQQQEVKAVPFNRQPECLEDYSKHFLRNAPERLVKSRLDVFIREKDNFEFAEILKSVYLEGRTLTWLCKQERFSYTLRWMIEKHRLALEKFYLYLPRSWQNAE